MSVVISNISNSFIQETEDCGFVLPVMSENDLKFQIQFVAGDYDETSDLMDGTIELFAVRKDLLITDDVSLAAASIGSGIPVEADIVWRLTDNTVASYWGSAFSEFETIQLNQCFRFALRVTVGATKYYFLLTCFKKVIEEFVSTIEYACAENSYGFAYCDQYVPNKVRLPFFLAKPNRKADRNIYFKSNGIAKVTKSVLRKEYEGFVDYLPDQLHDKLQVALEHETVFIDSAQYTGEVRISEDYDVKWPDLNDYLYAPASFKVNATPWVAALNNCANCDTWEETTCSSSIQITQSGIEGDSIFAQWQVTSGNPAKFIVKVNGEEVVRTTELMYSQDGLAPGTYGIVVIPICLVGTREFLGDEQSVVLEIPVPGECTPVFHVPRSDFEDVHVGDTYLQIIILVGTAPFAIISATKPAWMNVNISGLYITVTGTPYPGSEGNNIPVSITVSNACGEDTFSSPINVIGNTPFPLAGIRIWNYEEDAICTKPLTTVYLAAGNYAFTAGLKVYTTPALTTIYSLKYMLDTDGNLWRTNIFGQLQFVEADYC
jgi:hypothetical protein